MISLDKVDRSVTEGVFELLFQAARYCVGEGTQAKGMIAVIGSSDDFHNKKIGYCDDGMNTGHRNASADANDNKCNAKSYVGAKFS